MALGDAPTPTGEPISTSILAGLRIADLLGIDLPGTSDFPVLGNIPGIGGALGSIFGGGGHNVVRLPSFKINKKLLATRGIKIPFKNLSASAFRRFGPKIAKQNVALKKAKKTLRNELRSLGLTSQLKEFNDALRGQGLQSKSKVGGGPRGVWERAQLHINVFQQTIQAIDRFKGKFLQENPGLPSNFFSQPANVRRGQVQLGGFFKDINRQAPGIPGQGAVIPGQQPQEPIDKSKFPDLPVNELLKIFRPPAIETQQFQTPQMPGFNIDFFDRLATKNLLGGGGSNDFSFGGFGTPQQQQPRQQQISQGVPFSPTGGRLFSSKQKAPTGLAFLS